TGPLNTRSDLVALLKGHGPGHDLPLMGRVLGIRVSEAVADVDLVRVDRKRIVLCGASRRVWPRHVTGRIQHAAVLSGCPTAASPRRAGDRPRRRYSSTAGTRSPPSRCPPPS